MRSGSPSVAEEVFAKVAERSNGQCEAMVALGRQTWIRCGVRPVQIHHKLLRSRGGDVLDRAGETYHLIALCGQHHNWAHANPEKATQAGLIIDGQVTIEGGVIVYRGTDRYLSGLHSAYDPAF